MSITFTKYPSNSAVIAPLRPSLKLVSGGDLADYDLVNFSRDSKKWYWGSDGVLQEAAADKLPTSYDPDSGDKLGWLIEESRTNKHEWSEDLTKWNTDFGGTGSAPVITANVGTAPNGEQTADRCVLDKGSGSSNTDVSEIYVNYASFDSDIEESLSVWIKSADGNSYEVSVLGQSNVVTVTNEWQRIKLTNSNAQRYRILLRGNQPTDDYADILVWGGQIEEASFVSSYIPTEGSTVTRSADVANITDLSWYNQRLGTFVVEAISPQSDTEFGRIFSVNDGTETNEIRVQYVGSIPRVDLRTSNDALTGPNLSLNTSFKAACSFDKNDLAISLDGGNVSTQSVSTLPSGLTEMDIGRRAIGGGYWNSHIKSLSYYKVRLSNDKLQNMTG